MRRLLGWKVQVPRRFSESCTGSCARAEQLAGTHTPLQGDRIAERVEAESCCKDKSIQRLSMQVLLDAWRDSAEQELYKA